MALNLTYVFLSNTLSESIYFWNLDFVLIWSFTIFVAPPGGFNNIVLLCLRPAAEIEMVLHIVISRF